MLIISSFGPIHNCFFWFRVWLLQKAGQLADGKAAHKEHQQQAVRRQTAHRDHLRRQGAEDALLPLRQKQPEQPHRKRQVEQPPRKQGPQSHFGRAERTDLQQDRKPLHTEGGAAEQTAPRPGAGGKVAAGADFQQHGAYGAHGGREHSAHPRRQHPEEEHEAAELQIRHGRMREKVGQLRRRDFGRRGGVRGRLPCPRKPVQQRSRKIPGTQLRQKQQDAKLCAVEQRLPDRQDHERRPGTDAGGQERIRLARGELPGADGLCRRVCCRGKAAEQTDEQDPRRAGSLHPDAPRRGPERDGQQVARRAPDQQRRHHQKRKKREQQRPGAEGQPLPKRLPAGLRHRKRQYTRQNRQQKQTDLIHTQPLRFHIYGTGGVALHSRYGEGAGVKKQRSGRLSLREWFWRMFRQPPRGFYGQPSVYRSGDRMEIEQFRRILTYDEEKLCLEFRRGRFTVYGDELHIETLAAHRITLRGRVLRTEFDGDGEH